MYLKLGTIGVNYSTPEIDDFMIYSEVPDSSISYESPVLVRTLEELEIWFGKSMLDYPMLIEILNHGGVLYLYGPTSVEDREAGTINISGYNEVWFDSDEEIPIPETLMDSVPIYENVKYRVSEEDGQTEWWIWKDGSWLKESQFPQNLKNSSISLNNRDTLFLSFLPLYKNGDYYWFSLSQGSSLYIKSEEGTLKRLGQGDYTVSGINITIDSDKHIINNNLEIEGSKEVEIYKSYPGYSEDVDRGGIDTYPISKPFPSTDPRSNIIISDLFDEGNTHSIKIKYPKEQEVVHLGNGFFIFTSMSGVSRYACFGDYTEDTLKTEYGVDVVASGYNKIQGIVTLDDLVSSLTSNSLGSDALTSLKIGDGEIILYSKDAFSYSGLFFSDTNNIVVEIDEDTNRGLINQYLNVVGKDWISIMFWSKTIGRDSDIYDDSRDISISIDGIEDGDSLIKISRYDYSEFFNGRWGEIENKINQESKLVRCFSSDSEIKLPEGETYKLSGAVENKSDPGSSFWKSLYTLLDPPGETVCPDFFLIPYLYYYEGRDDKELIELAEKYNTQFVISEKYPYQLEKNLKGDEDRENLVMYFYGNLEINDVRFPAAYPFLIGVLENSSIYTAKLLKNTIGEDVDYNTLDEKKCNYLESNNQRYFYKKYNSGDNYITTGWRRFLIGKISRELEKNKWNYLGTRYTGIIKNRIEEVLSRVKNNFSMIRDIQISEFLPDPQSQTINMTIDIETTDLVDNHIELDILINYNKRYE